MTTATATLARTAYPALPPGPAAPWWLTSLRYVRDPWGALAAAARRYGDCFTGRAIGPTPVVTFSHPDAVKEIFAGQPATMSISEARRGLLEGILGRHSLVVLEGERHLRERRLLLPPFHGERMRAYGEAMQQVTRETMAAWPVARSFPVHRAMQEISLEVIMRAVFGFDDEARLEPLRRVLLRLLALPDSALAPFLAIPALRFDWGRMTPWGRFLRDKAELRAILLADVVRRRTETEGRRTDILSLLLEARYEDGQPLDDEELFDHMFTLLMAGHETTATTLAWALWCILPRPDVVERIRAEADAAGGDAQLTPEAAGRLEYLDAAIKETMRLYPVATIVDRRLLVPTRIAGWDLPAGTDVGAAIYLTHRHPELWPDPERFAPERFLRVRTSPHAYYPFGGGEHRCLGAAFATYEMRIVLAEVLTRAELRVAPGYRARPVLRAVTVGPSRGMPVVLERRYHG
jgi:cytochrome P450